jgi:hypothetical protein
MSYSNFEQALELAKQCKAYRISGGKSDDEIRNAESVIGLKFSRQNYDFYHRVGYLSFFGSEIFEIDPEDSSGILEGNSIAYALHDRKHYKLPTEWLPFYFFDDGYMGYLDYSQINEDGEPPVIAAIYNGNEYVVTEKVAEDFGDFLMQLVQRQLTETELSSM